MGTVKGKPPGYFKYVFAIDCETTGLKFNADDPSEGHQPVSWGIVVADSETLKPIEELYVEIKWNDASKRARKKDKEFGRRAESIHGLSYDYLEENGVTEEEAVVEIGNLLYKYNADGNFRCLGHNVHTFDMPFLRAMFRRFNIDLKFGSRHIDTSSIGFAAFTVFNSDQLFETVGFDARGTHNALDDAKMALESARRVRLLVQAALDG